MNRIIWTIGVVSQLIGLINGYDIGCIYPEKLNADPIRARLQIATNWTNWLIDNKLETPLVVRSFHMHAACQAKCLSHYYETLDPITMEDPLFVLPDRYRDAGSVLLCSIACYPTVWEGWANMASEFRRIMLESWDVVLPEDNPELNSETARWLAEGGTEEAMGQLWFMAAEGWQGIDWHPYIIGQIAGRMMHDHFVNDGWNQNGDLIFDPKSGTAVECTGHCRAFQDPTGYQPVDDPRKESGWTWAPESYDCEGDCTRWQPLLEADGYGSLKKQEFVVPFIGTEGHWYLRDPESQDHLETPMYNYRDVSLDVIGRLAETAADDFRKQAIRYHDNKLYVRGAFQVPIWETYFTEEHSFQDHILFLWGISMTEYDGVLHGWYEKRHHDLVRPTTVIKSWGDEEIVSYAGMEYEEPMPMKARDFEATIRVMPHGEHPSGSSCLCSGYKEFTDKFTTERYGSIIEDINWASMNQVGRFYWDNYAHLSHECGESRLWGGLHYPQSIPDGVQLCSGLGALAYDKITQMKGDIDDWDGSAAFSGEKVPKCRT